MKLSLLAVATVLVAAAGCAAPTNETAAADEAAIRDAKVKLPKGDTCRAVLAPLALGLADGALGLDYTTDLTVSLTSETETRLYTVAMKGPWGSYQYEVELDNDSASPCLFLSAKPAPGAELAHDRRTSMRRAERELRAPITIAPVDDDCASTVKLLAQAAGVSAVGPSNVLGIRASLESETEDRDYAVHVDGRSFVVDGHTFSNDYDFALNTSNDSASKCFVQDFHVGQGAR